jgi:alpha-D-ribose 1-methylphosphonate 5-triphosphate synthase subunit PhnL
MTEQPQPPSLEKVKQRAARMQEICLMFDYQIMVLDELIAQVEAENRDNPINVYRREKGKRLLENLMQQKSEESSGK